MSIERRRAKGEISTFVSSRNMAFRKQSHELFRQKGWLRLDELRVDGQTIAVLLGFEFGGAYFGNQLSFDANFASVRPVHCLLANRIRRLIADGVRRFDFLCGDLQYKREYFAQSKPELHLWLFPRTVRGMICAMRFSGRRLLAAAKRTWLSRRSEPHGKTNPRETAGDGAGGQPAVSSREAGSEHPTRSSERSGIRPAVVICAPDGSVPTALGVIRCLGRAGVPVTVIASPGSPFARSRYATEVVGLTPRELADPASLLACLTTIAREFDEPRPLFVASDRNAQFVHDHWDRLRDGYLYPLLAPESLHTCLDKRLTAETAHRAGVAAPRTRFCDANADIDSVIDDMSYPCVVKPASQALVELLEKINCPPNMHGKTWRAADHAALDGILRTTQAAGMPVVIQAEVGTPDTPILSCSVAVAQSGEMLACWTGVKLRKLPLLCGTATLAESRWMPELVGPAQHVVQAFGLRGVCEIEFAVDPATGAPMLIEVNPRSWVWVALAQRSGANLPFATYCDLTGHPSSRSAERDGLLWVSLWHDWTAYRRSSGTRGIRRLLLPLGYAASFRRWPEFAYFTCDDTVPGLIGAARFVTQDMRHKLIDSQAGVR
jgi:predicted ATP-grasp superfamily ATP-dependent carboligase